MNRIISINISGVLFNADENAYERLKQYLDAIKMHFQNKEGGAEILADIENRIAEMLLQTLSDRKEVITILDVERIIASMGQPEQMDSHEETNEAHTTAGTGTNAGPNWTFGSGNSTNSRGRRVYRDEDDKVIGGVCSGISAYLGIDPIWLRLAFGIAFLFFGSGFLLYVLLWIALPAAKTPSEKLEMRGENINISNIEKTVKANMEDIKNRAMEFGEEVKNFSRSDHARNAVSNVSDAIVQVLKAIAFVIIRIIYFIAIFIGISAFISLIIALFSALFTAYPPFIGGLFNDHAELTLGTIAGGVVLCIPFFALLLWGFNGLFHFRFLKSYVFGSLFFIWMLAVIATIYVGVHVANKFSYQESVTQDVALQAPVHDTLYIDANNIHRHYRWHYGWINVGNGHQRFSVGNDDDDNDFDFHPDAVKFTIAQSPDKNFSLLEHFSSRGATNEQAKQLASEIDYKFNLKDSLLILDSQFKLKDESKWRNQQVDLLLRVPAGKVIVMKEPLTSIMYDIPNTDNYWDGDMPNKKWLMTENGLKCLDCPKSFNKHHYRNNHHNNEDGEYEDWKSDSSTK
jgi:phage shock protein PspC (stress-responsive transcriptional regulator)